jgi:hypothetical protein
LKESEKSSKSWSNSHSSKKSGKYSSNLGCGAMKVMVVLEEVGVKENGAKARAA